MSITNVLKSENKAYFYLFLLISLSMPVLIGFEKTGIAVLLTLIPAAIYVGFIFDKLYKLILIFSIFLGFYLWMEARIQVVNLVSYALLFFFFLNIKTEQFKQFKLPLYIKIISFWLITAVFISGFTSPFLSAWSIYYTFMFLGYFFTGYIVYRTVINVEIVNQYLNYFYRSVTFYGLLIIASILITGNIRSFGISGPTISDMIVMALLIVFFKTYISGKYSKVNVFNIFVLFIVLITTLSRFSWIGFLMSFIYGMILVTFLNSKTIFSKKTIYISVISFLILVILLASGLYNLILNRLLDVNFSVLDTTREEGAVSNSLDTRMVIWITAFNAFLHNKFSGVGYFMFHKVSYNYNILPENLYINFAMGLDPHSTFLGFLTETGLLGFCAIFTLLLVTLILSIKAIRISPNDNYRLVSIILSILVFFIFTTSIYSGAFKFGYNAYALYCTVGLVIGNYVQIRNKIKINEKIYQ